MERRVALRAMMEIRARYPDQANGLSALTVRQVCAERADAWRLRVLGVGQPHATMAMATKRRFDNARDRASRLLDAGDSHRARGRAVSGAALRANAHDTEASRHREKFDETAVIGRTADSRIFSRSDVRRESELIS